MEELTRKQVKKILTTSFKYKKSAEVSELYTDYFNLNDYEFLVCCLALFPKYKEETPILNNTNFKSIQEKYNNNHIVVSTDKYTCPKDGDLLLKFKYDNNLFYITYPEDLDESFDLKYK